MILLIDKIMVDKADMLIPILNLLKSNLQMLKQEMYKLITLNHCFMQMQEVSRYTKCVVVLNLVRDIIVTALTLDWKSLTVIAFLA